MAIKYVTLSGRTLPLTASPTNYVIDKTPGGVTLNGSAGADQLMAGGGGDTMIGGAGDDTYLPISPLDVIIEAANGGIDTAVPWMDYILPTNIENMNINGPYTGIGNTLDNIIQGGAGGQKINGAGGDDILSGGAGRDVFIFDVGGGGDIVLDFATGAAGDIARVGAFSFRTLDQVKAQMTQTGADVLLTLSSADKVLFKNTEIANFTRENFELSYVQSGLKQTFNEDFNSLSLYNGSTGVWKPFYDFGTQTGLDSHTLTNTGEKEIYVDPTFKGTTSAPLGLNPFSIHDGVLDITATRTTATEKAALWNYEFKSGMLTTEKSFSQTYGYFEIRADLPVGKGLWPAFWLVPADGSHSSELDILESIGDGNIWSSSHGENSAGVHSSTSIPNYIPNISEGFHTYGMSWQADKIRWYLDGVEIASMETPANMHGPMFMIVNLAVGGNWAGNPAASITSATYSIDYIKAYSFETTVAVVDNVYAVSSTSDLVNEAANAGIDQVNASITYTLTANVENLTLTGSAAINGFGNSLNNVLTGNSAANRLEGGAGDDVLDGKAGADTMAGGQGDDSYTIDNAGDVVIEDLGAGKDTVYTGLSYSMGANIENAVLLLRGNATVIGNNLANVITGNAGNNILNGGGGADSLTGGAGNDTYYIDNLGDKVFEATGEGVDLVQATVNYTLTDNVENLILLGTSAISGYGNSLANTVSGNAAANTLDGGAGNDSLDGGGGNDVLTGGAGADVFVYRASGGADVITDFGAGDRLDLSAFGSAGALANSGVDAILTLSATETLRFAGVQAYQLIFVGGSYTYSAAGAPITNMTVNGSAAAENLWGGPGNDTLDGAGGADTLIGGLGHDVYVVDDAGDKIEEKANEGTDTVRASVDHTLADNVENLTLVGSVAVKGVGNGLANVIVGNALNNRLEGADGADTLDGGLGGDSLVGGAGDDSFYVDSAGDQVVEAAGEGVDTVYASVTYSLAETLENLVLTGTAALSGLGNALQNLITGNSGANTLDGGGGADTLAGGLGDDLYVVDNIGDQITEAANGGADLVQSSVTYTLSANVENLLLTGSAAIDGFGNTQDNVLTGNSAANRLEGGAGADTLDGKLGVDVLVGGKGDDFYYYDGVDSIIELANEGIDTVYSGVSYVLPANVENLILTWGGKAVGIGNGLNNIVTGNIGDNQLDGGAGDDTISGGGGADRIIGNGGADNLTGGAGADTFVYGRNGGVDTITDFAVGDRIDLSAFAGVTSTLTNVGADVLIRLSANESIKLLGVQASELSFDGSFYSHL